jgi:diguanylate cyclase (GGDEF)-like protein/excisionase family DNA binding protein
MTPVELIATTASGARTPVELSITVLRGDAGRTQTVYTAFIRDVSLLRDAQQREAALRLISAEASTMTDLPRIATSAALHVCQVLDAEWCAVLHADADGQWAVLAGADDVEDDAPYSGPLEARDGVEHIPIQTTDDSSWVLAVRRGSATAPPAASADFLTDVAALLGHAIERDLAGDRLLREALRDATTGLPNRVLLLDRVESALAHGHDAGRAAVLVLGIERFDAVRESVGHEAAEEVLRAIAVRLSAAVGRADTLARIGDDEFAVVCAPGGDGGHAITLAAQLVAAVAAPIFADEREIALTARAGIAFAAPGTSPTKLVRNASVALHRARRAGRGGVEVFDGSMRPQLAERLNLESDLRQGIERGELRVLYQPLVSLLDRTVVGVESLVRWAHPTRGLIPPAHFLPMAEQSGQITAIGSWILAEACRQAAAWADAFGDREPPAMTVNVSTRQLTNPHFVSLVADRLDATGLAAHRLVFDVTEGAFHDDPSVPEVLHELKALGVRLFLDDFLTGNAALTWLTRFPLAGLKLEAPFVRGLGEDPSVRRLLGAVCGMAAAFELEIVAEGVESEEQATILSELGCEVAQGYLFSRPVPACGLETMLARALPRAASAATPGTPAAAPASVTMHDAAVALGVSPSTVRRWADAGRLTAIRTSGGHRRFLVDDVRRLSSESRSTGAQVREVELPDHALPRTAALLEQRRAELVRTALAATYETRGAGWFAEPEGHAHVERWLDALASALGAGDYGPAIKATGALARRSSLGGVATVERVTFVDRTCAVLLRMLDGEQGSGELHAAQRVCAVLRRQALADVDPA